MVLLSFKVSELLPIAILLGISSIIPVVLAALKIKKIPAFAIHMIAGMILGSIAKTKGLFEGSLMEGLYTVGLGFLLLLSGLDTDYSVIYKKKKDDDVNINVFKISWILIGAVILLSIALSVIFMLIFPLQSGTIDRIKMILLITILFSSTFASVVIPIIHEKSFAKTTIGQIICTYSTIAELISIVSLSIFMIFDKITQSQKPWLLIIALSALVLIYLIEKYSPRRFIRSEMDGFTQLPIRVVTFILLIMMIISYEAGAEFILGAFLAGAILKAGNISHHSQEKIEHIGYGLFVPLFFLILGGKIPFAELVHDNKMIIMSLVVFAFLLLAKLPFMFLSKYYKANTTIPTTIITSITIIVAIALEHFDVFEHEYKVAFILGSALTLIIPPIVFYATKNFDECKPEYSHVIIEPHEIEVDENHKPKKHKY